MATVIEIDDELARATQTLADRDGLPIGRFVEAVLARAVADRRDRAAAAAVSGPVVIPRFNGGGGVVDGLTLRDAVARADRDDDLATGRGVRADTGAVVRR